MEIPAVNTGAECQADRCIPDPTRSEAGTWAVGRCCVEGDADYGSVNITEIFLIGPAEKTGHAGVSGFFRQ